MKIACYTIALNESRHAARWSASCAEADYRVVADTGSTDDTIALLRAEQVTVHSISIQPWRFDHARNAALALVPADADICVTLDMDEVLKPGWRAEIEAAWAAGVPDPAPELRIDFSGNITNVTPNHQPTRMRYRYIWNWSAAGDPLTEFRADRTHARHGYTWKHPVHETLYRTDGQPERYAETTMEIHHHADDTKPRTSYLPLLKLSVEEDPTNDRNAHYYARELMMYGQYAEAAQEFRRHLSLPKAVWRPERCASMRYLARCLLKLGHTESALSWLFRATIESPESREPWWELLKLAYDLKDHRLGLWAARSCLAIHHKTGAYIQDAEAWSAAPWDLGSVCAWHEGDAGGARLWQAEAERLSNDPRIKRNGELMRG